MRGLAPERARMLEAMEEARARTYVLVEPLSEADYRGVHHPVLGPIAWDVAHIGQQEDQWLVQTLGHRPETRSGFNELYDAYKQPRDRRAALPLLTLEEVREYHDEVRASVIDVMSERRDEGGFGGASAGAGSGAHGDSGGSESILREQNFEAALWKDLFVHHMVWIHEHQHNETMLQHLQAMEGGRYRAPLRLPAPPYPVQPPRRRSDGFAYIVGTKFPMGVAAHTVGTFDNEWPQHVAEVGSFWLARAPATNGQFLAFVEAGGYADAQWWHPEGWAFVEAEKLAHPAYWRHDKKGWSLRVMDDRMGLPLDRPVCNISWYEADAFARWAGCRLPTEAEWERAATWDPHSRTKRAFPWGHDAVTRAHANTDHFRYGTDPVGTHPEGVSPEGVHQLIGDVWEWTSSAFEPYPGFVACPYEDYSARFFDGQYKVLRGGSWASRPGCGFGTFRNWDWPIRRQIFAGVRLAADAPDPAQSPTPRYLIEDT